MTEDRLAIWTIYERPSDYPEHFVVRRMAVLGGVIAFGEAQLFATLDEARAYAGRADRVCIPRSAEDSPSIVESWV